MQVLLPDDCEEDLGPLSNERNVEIAVATVYEVRFTFLSSADREEWKDRLHKSVRFMLLAEVGIAYLGHEVVLNRLGIRFYSMLVVDLDTNEVLVQAESAHNTVAVLKEVSEYLRGSFVSPPLREISVHSPVVEVLDAFAIRRDVLEEELMEIRGVISTFTVDTVEVIHNKYKSIIVNKCLFCRKAAVDCASKKLLKCSRCSAAAYCSRECQKGHWKSHKETCVPKSS